MMKLPKKKFILLGGISLLLAAALLLIAALLPKPLASQRQAERWAGESGEPFIQYTRFFAAGEEAMQTEAIGALRQKLTETLTERSVETPAGGRLFCDAWSAAVKKLSVSAERGDFEAAAYAVGGSFFDFHPLRLCSGSYFGENDLMRDRVVIDAQLAWLLYGSTDLAGMTVTVGEQEFVIAGVVERESDRATRKVGTAGPMLWLPYEAYLKMNESAAIDCYEIVLPEPVEGFAGALLKEICGEDAVLQENTGRFAFGRSWKQLQSFGMGAVRTEAVAYPAWENAARYTEAWCALLRALALAALVLPGVLVIVQLVRLVRFAKRRLRGSGKAALEKLRDQADERRSRRRSVGKAAPERARNKADARKSRSRSGAHLKGKV